MASLRQAIVRLRHRQAGALAARLRRYQGRGQNISGTAEQRERLRPELLYLSEVLERPVNHGIGVV